MSKKESTKPGQKPQKLKFRTVRYKKLKTRPNELITAALPETKSRPEGEAMQDSYQTSTYHQQPLLPT
ncbi:hypothetical protein SynRS9907_02212 [Synechococcus sp. RS9907]|nr:hypothetical protein SynRS9907_02212 [Synechococcus sp. RS9907]